MENKLKVGITHGDINGVSYELVIKLMQENRICELITPVFYGSPKVAAYYRKNINVENFNLNSIQSPKEANSKRCNVINCIDDSIKVEMGTETTEGDNAAIVALEAALKDVEDRNLHVITAAPQTATSFKSKNNATGCIEYLARRYRAQNIIQLLVGEQMKVGFVTTHIPFKDIYGNINSGQVYNKICALADTLMRDFAIDSPRIAVLGLNPQAGANCTYGEEEEHLIIPAIEKARANGIMALGPYAADTLFSTKGYKKFDAVLAMFYEQGMIPFKTIESFTGAVLVAGLPIVYTTTVNGVAYDIVGEDIADESGLRNAVYLATDVYRNRVQYAELTANPLPHYDIAGNAAESEMNVEQIAGVKEEPEE